jgi:hypothetical protein
MNIYDEIAKVAHELYVKGGYVRGRDVEDWLAAERIVRTRHAERSLEGDEAGKTKKKSAVRIRGEKTATPARKTSATKTKSTTTRKKKSE